MIDKIANCQFYICVRSGRRDVCGNAGERERSHISATENVDRIGNDSEYFIFRAFDDDCAFEHFFDVFRGRVRSVIEKNIVIDGDVVEGERGGREKIGARKIFFRGEFRRFDDCGNRRFDGRGFRVFCDQRGVCCCFFHNVTPFEKNFVVHHAVNIIQRGKMSTQKRKILKKNLINVLSSVYKEETQTKDFFIILFFVLTDFFSGVKKRYSSQIH